MVWSNSRGVAGGQVRVQGVRALGHGAVLVGTCEQIWKYDNRRNFKWLPTPHPALSYFYRHPLSFCRKQRPKPTAGEESSQTSCLGPSVGIHAHLTVPPLSLILAPTPRHSPPAPLPRRPPLPPLSGLTRRLLHTWAHGAARCRRKSPASHRTLSRERSTGLQVLLSLLPTRLTTSRDFPSQTCNPETPLPTPCCWLLPHPSWRSRSLQQASPHFSTSNHCPAHILHTASAFPPVAKEDLSLL